MKANELRIGNLVYLVDKEKIWEILDGHEIDECNENPLVQPIPTTEEWLLDFGFEKMHDGNFWNKKLCIRKDRDLFYALYEQGRIYIQHVHKLQNLYLDFTDEELIKRDKK